ncbi:MAG TPA: bifunctional pyr operon transcriptional regulator/uracil phosphoribosyltransferase PyrR [Candidatus Limnocylindria bacterium]|jgi:pyrimidine operon attenuation protein/uracil phosphoribosyltransferase|nr:bifunctional pyr operon transcriptional regulator/uracil phosphoribosyltransferase PyrR [Candidatus Limnocylindria bacterium]
MNSVILDPIALQRTLQRMAHEIAERNVEGPGLVLVGVQKGGVYVARRLATALERILSKPVPLGMLDVTFHRDDLDRISIPTIHPTEIQCDINDRPVVLVDDVFYTGRTTRAALDALHDFGRPSSVMLAVLIDRGHRQLPIKPDFVGKNVPTSVKQRIDVQFAEEGGSDQVVLTEA